MFIKSMSRSREANRVPVEEPHILRAAAAAAHHRDFAVPEPVSTLREARSTLGEAAAPSAQPAAPSAELAAPSAKLQHPRRSSQHPRRSQQIYHAFMLLKRPGRSVLLLALLCSACADNQPAPASSEPARSAPFDLEERTIADLQKRMASGQDTARSLAEKYLARIEAIDRNGPTLRSIIEINPDALAEADRLDGERKSRGARGPLHGIPILLKDNIATGDRLQTTAGSLALAGAPAPRDAYVAAKLRAAGALVLGKTNLSEWANFRDRHSTSGWAARGGQTRNPYALDRSPSGSSSGSGAAVAASLAAAAVGTETDGSIVSPASVMGLVGIKPTHGLLSRAGIVPISPSQDTPGPMARTVADAAALLGAMVGVDAGDAATGDSESKGARDYSASLQTSGLKGARIGIVRRRFFGYSAAADRLAEAAIADMKKQGAIVVDPVEIATLGTFEEDEMAVLQYEFGPALKEYFAWLGSGAPVRSLEDVIAFNNSHQAQELPFFGQDLLTSSAQKGSLASDDYKKRLARYRRQAAQGIDEAIARHQLDALAAPTGSPAWLIDLVNGDRFPADEMAPSSITSVAGYPQVTVPMGAYKGLPIGLSFFGRAWSEPVLLRIAYAYEQVTKHRRPPTFAPTVDVNAR
jgi:amidase